MSSKAQKASKRTLEKSNNPAKTDSSDTYRANGAEVTDKVIPQKDVVTYDDEKLDEEILNFVTAQAEKSGETSKESLTAAEKARIERNRQKALLLRQARLSNQQLHGDLKKNVNMNRVIDSGGGFLIEEDNSVPVKVKRVEEPAPVISGELSLCLECDKPFLDSYLLATYDFSVCDKCRDSEEKHTVITKTQAKEMYLLSEADLMVREPLLKCVIRRNPRNNRWGDMKLYLKLQIEKRALEIWGSPEALEAERESRDVKREATKRKRYNKKMEKLRKEVRSSLYQVKTSGHEHEYGAETPLDGDTWKKTCSLCGHQMTFEKM